MLKIMFIGLHLLISSTIECHWEKMGSIAVKHRGKKIRISYPYHQPLGTAVNILVENLQLSSSLSESLTDGYRCLCTSVQML